MLLIGFLLLVLGYVLGIGILWQLGVVILVVGAIFWVLGGVGHPVAGRRYWY